MAMVHVTDVLQVVSTGISVVNDAMKIATVRGGGFPSIIRTGCSSYLSGINKPDLVPLRVFSLAQEVHSGRFTGAVPTKVLSQKKYDWR